MAFPKTVWNDGWIALITGTRRKWPCGESLCRSAIYELRLFIGLLASLNLDPALAADRTSPRRVRPAPSARDPHTPGYVTAQELPDGTLPRPDVDGNFIIGPTHKRAAGNDGAGRRAEGDGALPHDEVRPTARSIPASPASRTRREQPTPTDPTKLVVTTSHPAPYTRRVAVYVPKQYVPGTAAPFIVGADGPDRALFTALDNLIAQHRVPVMIAISIGNGSGDAQGSQRGLEYDTMSGRYAEFVETEVLPLVEKQCHVKLTKDPEGRATMGCSSGGSCALIMAWYHPELYHRVLTYSGTFVNQQWPHERRRRRTARGSFTNV